MEERKEKITKLVEDYCSKKGITPKKERVIGLIDGLDECRHSIADINSALKSWALKSIYLPDISQILREIIDNKTAIGHPQEAPFEQLTHDGKIATAMVARDRKKAQKILSEREKKCLDYALEHTHQHDMDDTHCYF